MKHPTRMISVLPGNARKVGEVGMKEIIIAYDDVETNPIMGEWVGELVRCKECRHVCLCDVTEIMPFIPVYANCTLTDEVHEPDWFCADGEREEE